MQAYSASCRLTLPRDMVFDYAADPANAAAWIPEVESWVVELSLIHISEPTRPY